jgi:amino acid permease
MIDITNTRTAVLQFHPPVVIYGMLLVMALVSAVLVGYQMAAFEKRSWLHIVLFIISITLTCYVILDIEYPRMGLIRVDAVDGVLRDVREGMRPNK